jgi:hypothetical protein
VKKIIINLGILFLASFLLQAYAQAQPDEKLFQEAKILIFDKKWDLAQQKLEKLLENYPESTWYSQAVFYKAKCLEEQREKELEALKAYLSYLELRDRNKSLSEESEASIINLAFKLYEKGKKSYLNEIEKRLSSSNKAIKYYAAHMLSYVKDKKVAVRSIPALKEILDKERDNELRDRAKIDLLRIDPSALEGVKEGKYESKAKILKIEIYEKDQEVPKVKIHLPWALADLALSAISEEDRAMMTRKGYNLDKIIKELSEFKGNIVEITGEDGTVIKIWIE